MKTLLIFTSLFFSVYYSSAQNKAEAEKIVEEGIAYHDKGDFEGALSRYEKALTLDKDNLSALAEKAMTLLSMQKYEESVAVCKTAFEKHPGEPSLKFLYVTCGNAYDGLKKTDKSLEIYDEGIKQFPDYYHLYFNKGVALSSVKRYDEALTSLQKAATCNPKHASTHNAIARLEDYNKKRIPALMAYARFLILEPESKRSKDNLDNLQLIMKGNVEKTGKNSITINISSDMLGDTTKNATPKENNFTSTDLILAMTAALDYDKKNKKKSEVENFIRKFETICATLKETKSNNFGFYWTFYAPYFAEMKDKNFVETFGYIVFASSGDEAVKKWLKSHGKEIDAFYEWSKNYNWKK